MKKIIVLEGNKMNTLSKFYDEVESKLTKNLPFRMGHNLDALFDILEGGYGVHGYHEPIMVVFNNYQKCQEYLKEDLIKIIDVFKQHDFINLNLKGTSEMTEFEKMIANQLYDPSDKELIRLRKVARNQTMIFNQLNDDEHEKRKELLLSLLGHLGKDSFIETGLKLDYGCNTFIGNDCFINYNCTILDCAIVTIKDNVFIGPNVSIYTPLHSLIPEERNIRIDKNNRKYDLEYCRPITIEENVWIAGSVVINAGVTIKKNSVIGSGSVVTKDIPEGVLAAGNPCKVIKKITDADRIEKK